jgi:peroxiredoxin
LLGNKSHEIGPLISVDLPKKASDFLTEEKIENKIKVVAHTVEVLLMY